MLSIQPYTHSLRMLDVCLRTTVIYAVAIVTDDCHIFLHRATHAETHPHFYQNQRTFSETCEYTQQQRRRRREKRVDVPCLLNCLVENYISNENIELHVPQFLFVKSVFGFGSSHRNAMLTEVSSIGCLGTLIRLGTSMDSSVRALL